MFNDVYKACPGCGGQGHVQISQVVYGFGEFNLDDPEDLADRLTSSQLVELYSAVLGEVFDCQSCGERFKFKSGQNLAQRLFAANCPCCSYPDCGHKHP